MRYIILVILNLPIIVLVLFNIVTQYKLKKISGEQFRLQVILWFIILILLILSFPVYNLVSGSPVLDSSELSLFDIVQTTAIVAMLNALHYQRQKLERSEKRLRDLHAELSIRLSAKKP